MNINIKFCCLIFSIVGLVALLLPSYTLAQEWKDGLIFRYVTGSYDSEIVPGETGTFFIEVANTSDISTANIIFTANAPKEWVVEFKPGNIEVLNAGNFQTVEVAITAPESVEKGGYSVTVIADSSIGRRVMDIYVRVEKGTNLWIWVGSILGVLAVTVFVIIFRRFNRD